MNETLKQPEDESRNSRSASHQSDQLHWFPLLVPIFVAVAVSLFSPNFRWMEIKTEVNEAGETKLIYPELEEPLGADFVQEYTGGYILQTEKWSLLYHQFHANGIQHNEEVFGFQWPEDKYFPMVYPPFYYWATSWFSQIGDGLLGYLWTARIWLWLSGIAVSLSGYLLHRFYIPSRSVVSIGLVATLIFVPLLSNFSMAQKGSFLLLILTSTFVLLHHNQKFWSGVVFGLIAFKPHLGLVIGISMLCKRQWQFCLGAVSTVALMTGASSLAFPGVWSKYLKVVGQMQDYIRNTGYQLNDSHGLWGAAELSLGDLVSSTSVNTTAVVLGVVVIALLVRVLWKKSEVTSTTFGFQFAAMIVAMILLSPHFYTYDLVVLLLAFALITSSHPALRSGSLPDKVATWRSTIQGAGLVYLMIAMFFLLGLFPKIANSIHFQLSVPLFFALLWLLPARSTTVETVETGAPAKVLGG
ncbi:MAG: glycosyltransferase family 87 protein [Planctomycetota bacterium]